MKVILRKNVFKPTFNITIATMETPAQDPLLQYHIDIMACFMAHLTSDIVTQQ